MAGTLWLVGTPIGNLGDVTARAREVLGSVEVIACEDTRRTRALLSHLGIAAPRLVSFFEGNEERRVPELLEQLSGGRDMALVSDAGMPALSDPGFRLVRAAIDAGIPVDVVPGPSAAVAALVVSGLATDRFAFEGFLPRRGGPRRARLQELVADPRTQVLFESPNRVAGLLEDAAHVLGDRRVAVCRELTKVHQEVLRGTLGQVASRLADGDLRGEVVVVIEGATEGEAVDLDELAGRVADLVAAGQPRKEAAARVAAEAGVSRRDLYEASLRAEEDHRPR